MQKPQQSTIAYAMHGNCYLNITSRCTLKCTFCPKYNRRWEVQDYDLRLLHEPDFEEVINSIGDPANYQEVVFCGFGEPTQRLSLLLEIAAWVKARGVPVRLNTDGLVNLIEGYDVTPMLAKVVDKVSVSLNADSEALYIHHTRPRVAGAFMALQDFAVAAKEAGMAVTLSAIDGLEGVDIAACEAIAQRLGVAFRRRVLDAVG
ncbi:MAG: radical SAM protein [Gammaproteobacteria bacterium]|nr:radical SAM protein [Gammaproteobacteria bacterium]